MAGLAANATEPRARLAPLRRPLPRTFVAPFLLNNAFLYQKLAGFLTGKRFRILRSGPFSPPEFRKGLISLSERLEFSHSILN